MKKRCVALSKYTTPVKRFKDGFLLAVPHFLEVDKTATNRQGKGVKQNRSLEVADDSSI